MGRKKKVEPDDKEQSARFVEAAEQIEYGDLADNFERVVETILLTKNKKSTSEAFDTTNCPEGDS